MSLIHRRDRGPGEYDATGPASPQDAAREVADQAEGRGRNKSTSHCETIGGNATIAHEMINTSGADSPYTVLLPRRGDKWLCRVCHEPVVTHSRMKWHGAEIRRHDRVPGVPDEIEDGTIRSTQPQLGDGPGASIRSRPVDPQNPWRH